MVVTAAGTQELLLYDLTILPWQDYGGPGDHIDPYLLGSQERFDRIELGGRPLGVVLSGDGQTAYVANYLLDCVQVVDLASREVARTIPLGGPAEPALARRGEAPFYDARRSLDQWYSCHSCHYEGGTNLRTMDTTNDGGFRGTYKTITPLFRLPETGPWTWHGWQTDLRAAMEKSLTDTLMTETTVRRSHADALIAYFAGLEPPPGARGPDGRLSEAAQRGRAVFQSERAGCTNCHSGEMLTDGRIHDLGLGKPEDQYQGFNTPSLVGVGQRVQWMHDGRAASLDAVLTEHHDPADVTGLGPLSDEQRADLIAYLKSL